MRKTRQTSGERIVKDIKRKTRKRYSAEEKIHIVLDGLRGEEWQMSRLMTQLYLDELEVRLCCHKWGCGKHVRIALPSSVETEGFQSGLA